MNIPQTVKKLALDAVDQKESTAFIRLYSNQGEIPLPPKRVSAGGIPEHVRKLAMDAIANKTTLAELKLIEAKGQALAPLDTPRALKCNLRASPVHYRSITIGDFER